MRSEVHELLTDAGGSSFSGEGVLALPTSFSQQRLWFLDQLTPHNPAYNIAVAVRLTGQLDVVVMEQSLDEIVRRHEVLRTTFAAVDGQAVQMVALNLKMDLPMVDLRDLPEVEREAHLQRLAAQEAQQPFDLTSGPLVRTHMLQLDEEEHVMLLTMHHIISDGWSMGVFIREMAALYEAFLAGQASPLSELSIQYADYAVWQREWLQGETLEKQLAYWRERLGDAPTVCELPTDRPRPAVQTFRGEVQSLTLSRELSEALQGLSRREGVTLFMTLLAAFKALIARHTGQERIVVGSPIANRNRSEIEGLIGFFVNTLVLHTDLSGDLTFRQLLSRVQETTLEAYAHQDLPFEKLVEELQPERDMSRTPLFQIFFNMLNLPQERLELPQLSIEPLSSLEWDSKFDLTLYASERKKGIQFKAVYNADLYESDRIKQLLEQFRYLLSQIAENPERSIARFSLVTLRAKEHLPDPMQALCSNWEEPVHARLPRQAHRFPTRLAVEDEQESWSYEELDVRSNQLANYLRDSGVQAQDVVAIYGHRSASLVWALLGILKAGAAFLILDPTYPASRLMSYLDAVRPRGWIQLEEAGKTPEALEEYVSTLSCHCCLPRRTRAASRGLFKRYSKDAPEVSVEPDDLAYVAFTSGSTGEPKGILGTHRPLPHFLEWHSQTFALDDSDRFSMLSGISHDPLLRDIFTPLWLGATLYIPDQERIESPDRLVKWMEQKEISIVHLTPAMGQLLIEVAPQASVASWGSTALLSLRYIFFGGDALSRRTVSRFQQLAPWVTCVNFYGATETPQAMGCFVVPDRGNVFSSGKATRRQLEVIPIGRGIEDVQLLILNASQQLAGIGEPGEIHVRTPYLTKGYLGDDALTQERFVTNPFTQVTHDRLYKTGDLGRYLPDGNVEFVGRADYQIKIRGFRVEPGEVETALTQHLAVREAVVRDWKDTSDNKRLVAYIVSDQERTPAASELRSFLSETLPSYMVPSAFTFLEALPLTSNGKVDRQALPMPDTARLEPREDSVPARNPTDEILAGIWAETLEIGQIGIHDDFFELGGHSLLAVQIMSRIREAFQVELPLRSLFEASTITQLAERIEIARQTATQRTDLPPLKPVQREGDLPLSFSQESLWFFDQLDPSTPLYNLPFTIHLTGWLDVAVLEQALGEVVRRHESLRTSFPAAKGWPVQVVSPVQPLTLPVIDLADLPHAEQEESVHQLTLEEAWRPFDLIEGALLRIKLLRLDDEEHLLTLTMHHIISDGWSMGILFREIALLYEALSTGKPSPLPELSVQYADFAVWQRQWLQGEVMEKLISYWRQRLHGSPPVLELPTDRPRPAIQNFQGADRSLVLSRELTNAIEVLSQLEGVTLFMTMLAAFKTLLYRYTGQHDIVVGTPIAGRNQSEVEGLIGYFVNTLVLRTDLSGNPTFRELLRQVREITLDAYAHSDMPFDKLVHVLEPERSSSYTPLFQVLFILQNVPPPAVPELSGVGFSVSSVGTETAKFDLRIGIGTVRDDRRLEVNIEYNTDLFDDDTIARMLSHFQVLLESIVANPSQRISDLPLLVEAERCQLLNEWSQTCTSSFQDACIHEMFEAQVQRTPDAVAVVVGEEHLTYHELNRRANQLAHYLQTLGVGPEVLVGVYMERSQEMVVGILGILKAGGAYVPLDPVYTQDRLGLVLEDAHPSVLLTQQHLAEGRSGQEAHVVCIDEDWEAVAQMSERNPVTKTTCTNLACVLYTSEKVDKLKGVTVEHQSAAALLHWAREFYPSEYLGGILASTPLCLGPSVFELFGPLIGGDTVILVQSMLHLPATPAVEQATLINTMPSMMTKLLEEERLPASVQAISLTGEAPRDLLVQQIYQCSTVQTVYGLYGFSENIPGSICALAPVEGKALSSVGRPAANTQVYLLDDNWQPVPVGIPGEIYLGGDSLARGYLNQPSLTAKEFIPNPFGKEPGARLYRTGDLARYLPDGQIKFLGRMDRFVEIRGFSIELGRIETVLSQHADVREAIVLVRDVQTGGELSAYVVPSRDSAPRISELRDYLKRELPSYMVPSVYVLLDALPLMPSGKVDRQALPLPGEASLSGDHLARMSDRKDLSDRRERLSAARRALLEKRLRGRAVGALDQQEPQLKKEPRTGE